MPGSARLLTSARISAASRDDTERAPDLRERRHRAVDVVEGVRGGELHAYARLIAWHDREGERDDVDPLGEQRIRQGARELRVAQHHRNDGMLARDEPEAIRSHPFATARCIREKLLAKLAGRLDQVEYGDGGGGDDRRERVREQIRPGSP